MEFLWDCIGTEHVQSADTCGKIPLDAPEYQNLQTDQMRYQGNLQTRKLDNSKVRH